MSITTYRGFLPYLKPLVPNCTTDFALQAIQLATRQFCVDSEGLIDRRRKFSLVADQKLYTVSASQTYFEILRGFEVRTNDAAGVTAGSYGTARANDSWVLRLPTTLEFFEAPSAAAVTNGLEVDLVVAPLFDTISMDFNFVIRWMPYILAGAAAWLMMMPKEVWSDPSDAAVHQETFSEGVALCRREVYVQFGTQGLKCRGGSFL